MTSTLFVFKDYLFKISRKDVANFLSKQISDASYLGCAVAISN